MEDIGLLKKISFFRDLSTLELAQINKITRRAAFREGEEVIHEGQPGKSLYIIKKGSARAVVGKKLNKVLQKGTPFGEVSFLDKEPASASVVADCDLVLIEVPAAALEKLISDNREVGMKIYRSLAKTLCRKLRDTNDLLLSLAE